MASIICEVPDELCIHMAGFVDSEPLHTFVPQFTRRDLEYALFEGSRAKPITLEVVIGQSTQEWGESGILMLKLLPESAAKLYCPHIEGMGPSAGDKSRLPDWRITGWAYDLDKPQSRPKHVQVVLRVNPEAAWYDNEFGYGYLQFVA